MATKYYKCLGCDRKVSADRASDYRKLDHFDLCICRWCIEAENQPNKQISDFGR